MSLTAAILLILLADLALIAALTYVMSHARHLTPHAPAASGPEQVRTAAARQRVHRTAGAGRQATHRVEPAGAAGRS
jgi:hypothetical protein